MRLAGLISAVVLLACTQSHAVSFGPVWRKDIIRVVSSGTPDQSFTIQYRGYKSCETVTSLRPDHPGFQSLGPNGELTPTFIGQFDVEKISVMLYQEKECFLNASDADEKKAYLEYTTTPKELFEKVLQPEGVQPVYDYFVSTGKPAFQIYAQTMESGAWDSTLSPITEIQGGDLSSQKVLWSLRQLSQSNKNK